MGNFGKIVVITPKENHAHDKEFGVAIDLLSQVGEVTAQKNKHHYVK